MKKVIDFLTDIRINNNRPWFEANKQRYIEANEEFNTFVEKLIAGIASFDRSVQGLTLKDVTYRFYRDIRFSPNKDPYKTHFGAYICKGGKKSGYAGYYFHIEPSGEGILGGNLITAGLYMPEPAALKSIRYEISENGDRLEAAIKKAVGFKLDEENKLKRLPAGYAPGSKYDELLKLKDIFLIKKLSNQELLEPGLLEKVIKNYSTTAELVAILNKAVKYAHEEM